MPVTCCCAQAQASMGMHTDMLACLWRARCFPLLTCWQAYRCGPQTASWECKTRVMRAARWLEGCVPDVRVCHRCSLCSTMQHHLLLPAVDVCICTRDCFRQASCVSLIIVLKHPSHPARQVLHWQHSLHSLDFMAHWPARAERQADVHRQCGELPLQIGCGLLLE